MSLSSTIMFLALPASVAIYIVTTLLRILIRQLRSPLRHLQGPPSTSLFMGNLREMHDQENNDLVAQWEKQYGSTFVYRGFMRGSRLMTTDPVAVGYIMGKAYDYPKPDFIKETLAKMASGPEGLLTVDGDDHRRQNPAFSTFHIKSLSPVFWEKAVQLRAIWVDICFTRQSQRSAPRRSTRLFRVSSDPSPKSPRQKGPNPIELDEPEAISTALPDSSSSSPLITSRPEIQRSLIDSLPLNDVGKTIDVLAWLARATLDVIGEAGFGYDFRSLEAAAQGSDDSSELAEAFGVIFDSARKFRVMTVLAAWFPVLRIFRRQNATMQRAQNTMRKIGVSLIEERQSMVVASQSPPEYSKEKPPLHDLITTMDVEIPETDNERRDILSILIRSNHSSQPSRRLSVNEMLCQISTFITAGHETTSTAITWTLYALARALDVQRTLRMHLRTIPLPPPSATTLTPETFDAILGNSYLDSVVRESLRLHAPVTSTMRVASTDDAIPVAQPFRDRYGGKCTAIHVHQGDIITIPIQALNKSKHVWGEDADVFRPERWMDETDRDVPFQDHDGKPGRGQKSAGAPGLWGNMLTFGNGNSINGNRSCIGYRLAINEIKIFLFALLRDIEFSIDPSIEIDKKVNVVTRPVVKSEPHRGNQMPLRLRHIPPDADDR
ncbi:uncharacterized protein FIBRA_02656 [Fibroporia radiculosa]|uniref:Cytochrome P450 n=1 Tax=Fibroporia radiculosa TaxID=599839 RepID=J4GN11_9APHY|nr:uncharacterized protein FIBRA_02656 [Fibroporia radiculosa]CCM00620.1 predicted protein [Fibroporia radiculosa]